jgi:hypothetical protein
MPSDHSERAGRSAERLLSLAARVALSLVLFPAIAILAAIGLAEFTRAFGLFRSQEAADLAFCSIIGVVTGALTAFIAVRKAGGILRVWHDFLDSKLAEPLASCIEFGFLGATLFGGIVLAVIFLLGHTRPIGWDFDKVLPFMGFGFVIFLGVGLRVGLARRRRRSY